MAGRKLDTRTLRRRRLIPLLSRGTLTSGPLSLGAIDLAGGHPDRATWLIRDVAPTP